MAAVFASIHRVMPVSKRTCHFESESLISIAHFRKIMIAVCGSSKRTTSCGKPPRVFNTDQHYRPACAVFIWLRSRPRPLAVVEYSKTQRPQHSPPPALGPLPWCGLKKISARKGLVFPMERSLGGNKRAHNLAMLPVGCQFKNSSAKRGCALLGNPKVSSASIQSCARMDNSTSGVRATLKRGFGRRCAPVSHGYDRIWCISWSSAQSRGGQA